MVSQPHRQREKNRSEDKKLCHTLPQLNLSSPYFTLTERLILPSALKLKSHWLRIGNPLLLPEFSSLRSGSLKFLNLPRCKMLGGNRCCSKGLVSVPVRSLKLFAAVSRAVVTNDHKRDSLKQQKCIPSQLWSLEI